MWNGDVEPAQADGGEACDRNHLTAQGQLEKAGKRSSAGSDGEGCLRDCACKCAIAALCMSGENECSTG